MLRKNTLLAVFLTSLFLVSCDNKTINEISKKVTEVTETKNTLPSINPSTLASTSASPSVVPSASSSITPSASAIPNLLGTFDIKKATEVVTNNCTTCHSTKSGKASAGISFDSEKEILDQMDLIKKVTFTNRSMPIGGVTMTEDDRNVIGLFGNQTPAPVATAKFEVKDGPTLITQKCASCHSLSQQDMINQAGKIKQVTFTQRSMPTGSVTITDEERSIIANWCDQQGTTNSAKYSGGFGKGAGEGNEIENENEIDD